MTQTLSAKEQAIAKIFSDDYAFTIPSYQRPYSWSTEQAQELLDDLTSAMQDAPADLAESAPYFLGSIVLIKGDKPEAQVVDGQQRLTTLTLLLAAIRAKASKDEVKKGITKRIYEAGDVVAAVSARYRLSLRERDREFFREYVQHDDGLDKLLALTNIQSDSQRLMKENAALFLEGLSKFDDAELTRLVQFIVTRCFLVVVATPDFESAYRIFGVMNSRGLDLTATDILKADIIGALPEQEREQYNTLWEDEESALGRSAFNDLFSHIRMVYRKAKPQGTLLKEFKAHVLSQYQPKAFINDVLNPMAEAYSVISAANYSSPQLAEPINAQLRWLDLVEFKDWVPPALAFFVRHSDDPAALQQFFTDLERLAYSLLIRKVSINPRIERFSKLTAAIETGQDLYADGSPLQLSSAEQDETYQRLNGPLYKEYSAKTLRIILLRLDAMLADGTASYQHEVVSIEHVMPQQPATGSKWKAWVPDVEEHQYWVHRLGNLALLSRKKNSAASNYEFAQKKNAYFTKQGVSAFAMTTQVLQAEQWTVDVMQQRQQQLLNQLERLWRLDDRLNHQQTVAQQVAQQQSAESGGLFELNKLGGSLVAFGQELGTGFKVFAGSKARATWAGKPHHYQALYDELVACGVLVAGRDAEYLQFSSDYVFNSPSAASAIVVGRPDNGRDSWRLKGTSITYNAWLKAQTLDKQLSGRAEELIEIE
jgi:hypothetical protein